MVSGYNNFPEKMFNDNGNLIVGRAIPGLYDELITRFSNNKPFFANFDLGSGVKISCCPVVTHNPVDKRFLITIYTDVIAVGQDNIIVAI